MIALLGTGAVGPLVFGAVCVWLVFCARRPLRRVWVAARRLWWGVVDVLTGEPVEDMVAPVEEFGRCRAALGERSEVR